MVFDAIPRATWEPSRQALSLPSDLIEFTEEFYIVVLSPRSSNEIWTDVIEPPLATLSCVATGKFFGNT
jgi:hypothetical protein